MNGAPVVGGCCAVVLNYRGWPDLGNTLTHLLRQLPAEQIVVVDNASGDGSAERIRSEFPELSVLESAGNGGYAAGMQLGLDSERARAAESVLVLTHECALEPHALKLLREALDGDPRVAVAAPLLGRRTTGEVWSAGGRIARRSGQPRHLGAGGSLESARRQPPADVDWADGAALLLRRSALDAVGSFDPDFFLYDEEVDLALRLRRAGWLVRLVPSAVAWQEPGQGGMPPYLEVRNRLLLWRKQRRPGLAAVSVLFSVYQMVLDLRSRRRGVARLRFRGLLDGATGRLDRGRALVRQPDAASRS